MSIVVYHSITHNNERFVEKLKSQNPDLNVVKMREYEINKDKYSDDKIHLITMTTGIGEVAPTADQFVKNYKDKIVSVCSSGNQNWGQYYGAAADIISSELDIPKFKVELSGDEVYAKNYLEFISSIDSNQVEVNL